MHEMFWRLDFQRNSMAAGFSGSERVEPEAGIPAQVYWQQQQHGYQRLPGSIPAGNMFYNRCVFIHDNNASVNMSQYCGAGVFFILLIGSSDLATSIRLSLAVLYKDAHFNTAK